MKDLIEIFYQPGKVFERLPLRKNAWILPMLFDSLLLIAISWVTPHYMGRANLMRQQLESLHMSPETMQKALESANSPAAVYQGLIFSGIGACVVLLIVSGVLFAFGMMTRQPPRWGTMLSMVCLAYFPYYLIVAAMTTLVLISSPDPTSLNAMNLLATNVGAFTDKATMAKGLYALLSSLDVLSFVEMFLLALGFSKITKSGMGFGLAAVFGMWILYVSVKMGISMIF